MKVKKRITLIAVLIIVFGALLFDAPPKAFAESSHRTFTLSAPGVALEQPDTLLVASQLNNTSRKTAFEVKIDSIRLDSAPPLTPIPVLVGEIDAGRSAIVQVNFDSSRLTQEKQYRIVMHGSYEQKGKDHRLVKRRFSVENIIVLPPAAPGSASVGTATVPANTVTGAPFPHQPREPRSLDVVNQPRWTVPTGEFVPGTPTPSDTSVQKAPTGEPR